MKKKVHFIGVFEYNKIVDKKESEYYNMKDVVEQFHEFWSEKSYSINQYNSYEDFLNNTNDKYSIFHPEDREQIKHVETITKDAKQINEMINYANGLYDEKNELLENVDLRPIIPQPAFFEAENEEELKKVKVVVLTTNPGYTPRISDNISEKQYQIYEQERLHNSLTGKEKYVPWAIPEEIRSDEGKIKRFIKNSWHYRHFIIGWSIGDKPTGKSFKELGFIKNDYEIMQIDYFTYQTKSADSIPKFFLTTSFKNSYRLKSQEINFELLNYMIEKTDAIFICKNYPNWKKTIQYYYPTSLDKFRDRAYVFHKNSNIYLSIKHVRSVSEDEEIEKLKKKCWTIKDADIFKSKPFS